MRPGILLFIVFAMLAALAAGLAGAWGWVLLDGGLDGAESRTLLFVVAALILVLFALALAWTVLYVRIARPLDALAREIQTLTHASKARPAEIPEEHAIGGLPDALNTLIEKFIAARDKTDKAVEEATAHGETYRRRLEAILLDLSEGVIVCNLDHRILLYNQAAMRILKSHEALGLGRRLFGLFARAPIQEALDDLIARQEGDATRKLGVTARVQCERRDAGPTLEARLALVCSDEVRTEGYVLTFSGPEDEEETEVLPSRPEFYDFDLFGRAPERELGALPLKELRCVVFDTETTGLKPSEGDELISIGAVRVVNGRIVTGETFTQLIDPGRTIPEDSTRFHGLTNADVKGAPRAAEVLPRFHAFIGRSVLVAHNAAFDMKFLALKEAESGISFASPVLDILLLSAFLHDHAEDHSLEATARRLGVEPSGRHSALGDAMTTAAIFVAMLDPLAERGVVTLDDALAASAKMAHLRKQQARF